MVTNIGFKKFMQVYCVSLVALRVSFKRIYIHWYFIYDVGHGGDSKAENKLKLILIFLSFTSANIPFKFNWKNVHTTGVSTRVMWVVSPIWSSAKNKLHGIESRNVMRRIFIVTQNTMWHTFQCWFILFFWHMLIHLCTAFHWKENDVECSDMNIQRYFSYLSILFLSRFSHRRFFPLF